MKVLERDEWHHSLQIGNLLWMFNYAHGRPPGSCRRGGEALISAWEKKVRINISKRGLAVLSSRQQVSRVRSATWPSAPNSHHSLALEGPSPLALMADELADSHLDNPAPTQWLWFLDHSCGIPVICIFFCLYLPYLPYAFFQDISCLFSTLGTLVF